MAKKKYNKPIMIPEASDRLQQLRCEIAKKLGYTITCDENWWDILKPLQQSEINGMVTKMMVQKAKMDMMNGTFLH
ncbi:MAG: hypothetical protein K0R18_7 [Bacillales bacterium]|jgi:hypothetical protein|nr:hypothetical protein [Bacillales bacterium]